MGTKSKNRETRFLPQLKGKVIVFQTSKIAVEKGGKSEWILYIWVVELTEFPIGLDEGFREEESQDYFQVIWPVGLRGAKKRWGKLRYEQTQGTQISVMSIFT